MADLAIPDDSDVIVLCYANLTKLLLAYKRYKPLIIILYLCAPKPKGAFQ